MATVNKPKYRSAVMVAMDALPPLKMHATPATAAAFSKAMSETAARPSGKPRLEKTLKALAKTGAVTLGRVPAKKKPAAKKKKVAKK
jgi:hypothetical protein